jgi:hypothetical protein
MPRLPFLKPFLICVALTGILAFWPDLVIGAYLVGGPLGLILSFTPSVALYLGLFLVGSLTFSRFSQKPAWTGGLLAAVLVAIVPPLYLNARNDAAIAKTRNADVNSRGAASSAKSVLIRQPSFGTYSRPPWNEKSCDDLCHILLLSGAAESVTMAAPSPDHGVRYVLIRAENCESVPSPQGFSWSGWPNNYRSAQFRTAIAIRQSEGLCIVRASKARQPADISIALFETPIILPNKPPGAELSAKAFTIEISDREGVVHREARLTLNRLFTPLLLAFTIHGSAGSFRSKGPAWFTQAKQPFLRIADMRKISAVEAALGHKLIVPQTFGVFADEGRP